MSALICGSIAFDTVMLFKDRFGNHILPDKVHMLNVAFLVPEMRREFGGCAGNIAYNLQLLGGEGYPLGTVGDDWGPYAQWMDDNGIPRQYIKAIPNTFTAQAFITSDLDDNQITAFHPGAMAFSGQLSVPTDRSFSLAIVAPDSLEGMLGHGEALTASNTPFIFDPGQAITQYQRETLLSMVERATWVAANDYECALIQEITGLSQSALADRVEALIITLGAKGSRIMSKGHAIDIPPVKVSAVVDPTGCGDAYRAGLLLGLMNDMDWETTGRIASLAGAMKIESHGPQNHRYSLEDFKARFAENFGYSF